MIHQNEEARAPETKSRSMITDVNLEPENISAESPKESIRMTAAQRNGKKEQ